MRPGEECGLEHRNYCPVLKSFFASFELGGEKNENIDAKMLTSLWPLLLSVTRSRGIAK
jgi:hypothetical protein